MLTTAEIEHTIAEAYRHNQAASLRFEQPGLGRLAVEVEALSGVTLIQNSFSLENQALRVLCQRAEPVVMMYFQLRGGSQFLAGESVHVPERHHSLKYYPTLQTNYLLDPQRSLQDVVVKFDPKVVVTQLLEEELPGDDWYRRLERGDDPFAKRRESQRMNPRLVDTLHQLLHCPYTGKLGQTYKEALLRLLLIDQFTTLRQVPRTEDAKLTRRDVETLHELKRYLDQHFLEDLSLDKIARMFGLNTFKLKYGFRSLFHTSVMRHIDDQRMSHARQLLLEGNREVFDVAEHIGYRHYANFSAAFKRRFGYPPSRLRSPIGTAREPSCDRAVR